MPPSRRGSIACANAPQRSKTPFCGKPGCEAPAQQKPATARPFYADETDIPDPLARLLHNAAVAYFDDLRPLVLSVPDAPPHHRGKRDDEAVVTAATSLLSGFLTDIEPARKAVLIEGIYRALKHEHNIP